MRTDPEPQHAAGYFHTERAVVDSYPRRIEASDLFEVQRWVTGIAHQMLEAAIR